MAASLPISAKEKFYRYFFRYANEYVKFLVNQVSKCADVFNTIRKRLDEKVEMNDESEDNDQ